MPFSVDLKPCSDCRKDANCALRQFKDKVEASIAALEETGENIPVDVPEEVSQSNITELYNDGVLRSTSEVFVCNHGKPFIDKGKVTIVYQAKVISL